MALLPNRRLAAVLSMTLLAACSGTDPTGSGAERASTEPPEPVDVEAADAATAIADLRSAIGRVDLSPTGDRIVDGAGSFGTVEPLSVDLDDGRAARWIVPSGPDRWSVVLDDGSSVDLAVTGDGVGVTSALPPGALAAELEPPMANTGGDLVVGEPSRRLFTDPLPDTRVVTDGGRLVALGGPTDRYAHGVLGDPLEASTISSIDADGTATTIVTLDAPDVFEAVGPMLADVDADGDLDVVVTVSNADSGARISVFDLDGTLVAETPAIGRGNRWRNLLAVAPTGPAGEVELVDVQTPHIGGILQFFRHDGSGTMRLVASTATYSTHSIGSRNVDQGIVTDADGDGRLDVLLPTQDQRELAVITRDDSAESGVRETVRVALEGRLSTNVAAASFDGTVGYAVGTDDGRVLIWVRSG